MPSVQNPAREPVADRPRRRRPGFDPFAGLLEGITDEERNHPMVVEELHRRVRHALHFSALSGFPTLVVVIVLLWGQASRIGLMTWFGFGVVNSLVWMAHLRRPTSELWKRHTIGLQFSSGLFLGALPLLAMPSTVIWQTFMVAISLYAQSWNVLFASQVRVYYHAFTVPQAVVSMGAYLLLADGSARWGTVLIGFAAVFGVGLSRISYLINLSGAVLGFRSRELADGLRQEREALAEDNLRLAEQARTDPLTRLPNRLGFLDRLEEALRNAEAERALVAVGYVDLDGFTQINDTLGHRAGDLVLVALVARLHGCLEPEETLARFGGDELVVLSPRLEPGLGLKDLGRRLRHAFIDPVIVDDRTITIGASIGLADSTSSKASGELLRFADIALYRSKRAGEGRPEIFDAELHRELRDRRVLEQELTMAVDSGELVPYLQPVVAMDSGRMVAAEALARWEHPGGVRVAGQFIEAAAELGFVERITETVLGTVLDHRLLAGREGTAKLPIAFNVSPPHLERLLTRYEDSDLLEGLTLEISEESSFSSVARANELLARAKAAGASILLDDFGVRFSSLARALELEVDGYKIDRRFVVPVTTSTQAQALIAGVVEMANRQERLIVAEGVETMEQAQVLLELGVTLAQGFLYAQALPMAEVDQLVRQDHRYPAASPEDRVTP